MQVDDSGRLTDPGNPGDRQQRREDFHGRTARLRRALSLARAQRWSIATILLAGLNAFEPLILKYIFDGLGQEDAMHYYAGRAKIVNCCGKDPGLGAMLTPRKHVFRVPKQDMATRRSHGTQSLV